MRPNPLIATAALLLAACAPCAAGLVGSPIQLNSGGAFWPDICYNPHSDQHLVLWVDVTDVNGWQLKGRRLDPTTWSLVGAEFYVSPDPANVGAVIGTAAYNPSNHEWLVVYQGLTAASGGEDDVLGQRIASDGSKVGGYISLVQKTGFQNDADVAYDAANDRYLVVWGEKVGDYKQVKGRFFDATGSPIGSELLIRDAGAAYASHGPKVACNPVAGEFMVVWMDYRNYIGSGQDNGYADVYGQRVSASGMSKIGSNIAIYWGGSPYVPNGQDSPGEIVCNPTDGRYFIAIRKLTGDDYYRTYGLIINSDGTWHSRSVFDTSRPEYGVVTGLVYNPVDNTYFTTWEALNDGQPNVIHGRQFDSSGLALAGMSTVNSASAGVRDGVLAIRPSDGLCVELLCTDSGGTIYAQRFVPDAAPPGIVWLDETFDTCSDGSLENQGYWRKSNGKGSCVVQSTTRVGATGKAVEIMGSSTVYDDASHGYFGTLSGGYQRISFDMRRNAPTTSNQGYVAILNSNAILTRVYWGANFNILHGPGASFTTLVANPTSSQWYHVEVGLNLSAGTLDAWVDGVQKVFAAPFYQPANSFTLINLTGYSAPTTASYLDNLKGERVTAVPAAPTVTTPTLGASVETQNPHVEWTGEAHDAYEVHVNTSNVPTDGSAYDSGHVTSSTNHHVVGPLARDQNYYVFVRLRNNFGWGDWSAAGYWFRIVANTNPPGAPSSFLAVGVTSAVRLSWTNPTDLDLAGIMIRCRGDRCPTSASDGVLIANLTGVTRGAGQSYTHTGAGNGVKHYYAAFAYDDGGLCSAPAVDSAAAEQWTVEYHADAMPSSSTPVWTMLDDGGSESWAHIEPTGGVLHVLDNSTDWGSKIRWYRNWAASNTAGSTVAVRARCDSVTFNAYTTNVKLCDGVRCINFAILPDKVAAKADATTTLDRQYALDGTAWHEYRFTLKGATYSCYVDENPTPVFAGTAYASSTNQILFGADGSQAMQSIYFDYLFYRTDTAAPPASENVSILDAKLSANSASVKLAANVVTAAFADYLYIQSPDGLHGLRVDRTAHGLAVGQGVDCQGAMATNADGERYLAAASISAIGSGTPGVLGLVGSALGGSDFAYVSQTGAGQRGEENATGLNNVGLLVRVWGRVTSIDASGNHFWLDDGSGPVKVWTEALAEPTQEGFAVVTGVCCLDASSGHIRSAVRPRTQTDIEGM